MMPELSIIITVRVTCCISLVSLKTNRHKDNSDVHTMELLRSGKLLQDLQSFIWCFIKYKLCRLYGTVNCFTFFYLALDKKNDSEEKEKTLKFDKIYNGTLS